jgi:hypothetical protein
MANEQKKHDEKKELLKTDSKPLKKGQERLNEGK